MASDASDVVRIQIQTLFQGGTSAGLTDGQLLERFMRADGEAAAAAFAVLVERHGPMVLGVCRGVLGDAHAAEDASQATFLVLARSAGAVRRRESVASWLFGVARRVAIRARRDAARRRELERRGAEMAARRGSERDERSEVVDELDRLPESLRLPIVLCDLEGHTQEQAAEHLRWPLRTFQRRLAAGRERLRARLIRRGLDPAHGLIGAPAVSAQWADATVRAALGAAGKLTTAGTVPAAAKVLSDEVFKTMFLHRVGFATLKVLSAACVIAASAGAVVYTLASSGPKSEGTAPAPAPPPAAASPPRATSAVAKETARPAPGVVPEVPHRSRIVEGRVVDPGGRPAKVDFAWIFAHGPRTTSPSVGPPAAELRLNEQGEFRAELPAEAWTTGPLDLTILAEGFAPIVRELPAGDDVARANLTLEPSAWRTIEDVVTDRDGRPIAGADYTVLVDGKPLATLKSDAEGRCKPTLPVGFGTGVRIVAEGFRPVERFRSNAPQAPAVDGIRLRRRLHGDVRDAHGDPAAKGWVGGEIRPGSAPSGWVMSALPLMTEPARTDAEGRFSFDPPSYDHQRIVFASRDFSQVAVHTLRDDDPDEPLQVRLEPVRAVRARLVETPRDRPAASLQWTIFTVSPSGRSGETWAEGFTPDFNDRSPGARSLRVLLPPGRYRAAFQGDAVHRVVELTVPKGDGPLDLPEIGLRTQAAALMAGKPAAEIEAADLQGRRVRLADYRGKVVVLDFWGSWCGPCVAGMPRLMALREEFRGQPLEILALHDASVDSAEAYRRVTARARVELWNGRELPFPVLLDRRPQGKSDELSRPAPGEPGSGVTADRYEINVWPSTFVIDRAGRMVGQIEPDRLPAIVREQLGMASPPPPRPAPAAPVARQKGPLVFRGRVVGPDGAPVSGATVSSQMSSVKESTVRTGADGSFALTLLDPNAPLAFLIEARGFAPRAIPFSPVGVLPSEYRLATGATVVGRVRQHGEPVVGVVIGLAHADGTGGKFLGHWEAATDAQGRFRFPNVPAGVDCNLFGTMRSLGDRGGIASRKVRIGAEGSTFDAGDLEVGPAHTVTGRIVFADGRPVPRDAVFQLGVEQAWDLMEVAVDAQGRFSARGVPNAQVSASVTFPTREGRMFAPDGYRLSAANKGLDPAWPYRLLGRVDRDVSGLVILFEPGPTLPSRLDQGTLADFREVKDGPLTGAPARAVK